MGMKNIIHRPHLDIEKACALYSEKDGVPVTYVCTSATTETSATSADIFFRESPHPEFGNRYIGLHWHHSHPELPAQLMITNADKIENLDFDMVEVDGELHYSRDRHDFYSVGPVSIDGGRAYLRLLGDINVSVTKLKVKDGVFVDAQN